MIAYGIPKCISCEFTDHVDMLSCISIFINILLHIFGFNIDNFCFWSFESDFYSELVAMSLTLANVNYRKRPMLCVFIIAQASKQSSKQDDVLPQIVEENSTGQQLPSQHGEPRTP